MKIITRYITYEFIRYFILCLIIFLFLYLVIDVTGKIDNFGEAGVSAGLAAIYFLYKIPRVIVEMMPIASVISAIILICLMKKNNEIMAMRASGIDIIRRTGTIIILSVCLVIVSFLISEIAVPYTISKSNKIWKIEVEKLDPGRFYGSSDLWYKSPDSIYWIKHFDGKKNTMQRPSFYFFNDQFILKKRIHGNKGIWKDGTWTIEDGIIQELQPDGNYSWKKFKRLRLDIPEPPEVFARGVKDPEDMSIFQLKRFSKKLLKEGYDNTKYQVDYYVKTSFPFITLVLVLIGIPVALNIGKGGVPLAVSIGVAVCLFYMICFSIFRSLGFAGILPPVFSAWAANLIFFMFGIYLTMNVDR